jgi:hypothetical protein
MMAVGQVLKKKGYTGLTVSNIATEAGLHHKLIYLYFGSVENLIETYIKNKDYWQFVAKGSIESILGLGHTSKEDITSLLKSQFQAVYENTELQKIILWEISEQSDLMLKIAAEREETGEKLFGNIDPEFSNSTIDLPAILAVVIGGSYYLPIHAKNNGSTFCGIDINEPNGRKRINDALEQMMDLCYQAIAK